jgi:hypothetical protein
MWTNLHSGLKWLAVALVWAGTGQYLQTRVYVERRLMLVRRVAQGRNPARPDHPRRIPTRGR